MNQNQFTVGVDVDGILRNWLQTILQQVNIMYETKIFNKDITSYDMVGIIKGRIPGFDRKVLEGIHKRCVESGKMNDASCYKDGFLMFKAIYDAGFSIRFLTCQPLWARKSFQQWVQENYLADKIAGIDFLDPLSKAEAKVSIIIDDNPHIVATAAKLGKPSILWQRMWNKTWQYPDKDISEDMICYTVLPKKALQFVEHWYEKTEDE